MKAKNYLSIMMISAATLSCSGQTKSSDTDIVGKMNEAVDETLGKSIDKYTGKLDELLTLTIASEAIGYEESEAKKDYNKVLKNPATHSLAYRWEKGRQKSIKNPITKENMEIPTSDFVELSWVKSTTLKEFKHNYHTPTAEELANADKAMNAKLQEMESEGKINKEQGSSAKGLAAALGEGLSYDEVPGVGDYAVWNNKDKKLKVFYKGLEFQIIVETGNDESVNRQKSVEVAKKIIQEKLR